MLYHFSFEFHDIAASPFVLPSNHSLSIRCETLIFVFEFNSHISHCFAVCDVREDMCQWCISAPHCLAHKNRHDFWRLKEKEASTCRTVVYQHALFRASHDAITTLKFVIFNNETHTLHAWRNSCACICVHVTNTRLAEIYARQESKYVAASLAVTNIIIIIFRVCFVSYGMRFEQRARERESKNELQYMRIHWRWQDASRATINNTDSAGRKKQTMSGNSVFCTQYAFAQVFIILLRRCANECQNTREQSELVWRDTFEKWTQRRQRRNSQNAAKQNETNKWIKENRKSFSLSTAIVYHTMAPMWFLSFSTLFCHSIAWMRKNEMRYSILNMTQISWHLLASCAILWWIHIAHLARQMVAMRDDNRLTGSACEIKWKCKCDKIEKFFVRFRLTRKSSANV